MENKVLLYDVNGKKIGETFVRRARQLVRQQRAMWTDDSQTAVRFAADADDWGENVRDESPVPIFDDEGWMVDLAKKRILQRRLYIAHSVAFGLGTAALGLALALVLSTDFGNNITLGVVIATKSIWFIAYIAHTINFAINMHHVRRPDGKGERRARTIEKEVADIKKRLER